MLCHLLLSEHCELSKIIICHLYLSEHCEFSKIIICHLFCVNSQRDNALSFVSV